MLKRNVNTSGRCRKHPEKPLYMTSWRPPEGIDKRLREYRCQTKYCDTVIYRRISEAKLYDY
jgi:hypothetical protein